MPRRTVVVVAGARPNFMKVAPLLRAFATYPDLAPVFVHTGQHYDQQMSGVFFADLGLPEPDVHLGVGSGTHAEQTAKVMLAFEPEIERRRPDMVVVVGDVNSTVACALTAAKLNVPIAHVEAGVRSFDRSMPEEINRVVTDALSDLLFPPSAAGQANLAHEGKPADQVFAVGHVMIDTLFEHRPAAERRPIRKQLGLDGRNYALLTLHRAGTVDNAGNLHRVIDAVADVRRDLAVVFPVHPRTTRRLEEFGLLPRVRELAHVRMVPPLGYLDFVALMLRARLVITDSGGIQPETTALGVPCLTLRERTEWPETIEIGTNTLVGMDTRRIVEAVRDVLGGHEKRGSCPPLWDGKAASRIARVIRDRLEEMSRRSTHSHRR